MYFDYTRRDIPNLDRFLEQQRTSTASSSIIWPPSDVPEDVWLSPPLARPQIKNPQAWAQVLDKAILKSDQRASSSGGKKKSGVVERCKQRRPWRSFKQVSVAGIDAALDRRSPLLRRLLWTCVLIVCMVLMFAQCLNRVLRYMEEPVDVNVRVTHNESLEYPSITVCNKTPFNRTAALELLVKHKVLPPEASVDDANISLLVGVDGLTPTAIWTKLAHRLDIFITECWFGRGITCDLQGEWRLVHTVTGPCHTYRLSNTHVEFVGSFHNLYMKMWESTPALKEERGFRILVHKENETAVLTSRTQAMSAELGWSREIKMELRKFYILNTAKQPCNNDVKYSLAQCQLNCFQAVLKENNIKCRMPYMSAEQYPNITECATPKEYEEAVNAIHVLLISGGWSSSACNCPQQCRQTAFQMYPENIAFKPDHVKIRIFYDELIYEQITEEVAYNIVALLCDIGGTLGLLMGASVLTVCELIEVVWSRFLQTCCGHGKQKPKKKNKIQVALVEEP